jgi:hypothetical protein
MEGARPPGVRRRLLAKRLALAAAALILPILGLELFCRATDRYPPAPRFGVGERAPLEGKKNFVADAELGWRMRAGAEFVWKTEGVGHPIRAGADGFRVDHRGGSGTPGQADAAAPRIAFAGDSFTFGTGVEFADTFAARAAAALGARVENRGMPGFGVDQMWRTVERVVLAEDAPDLLVVAFILDDFERSLTGFREQEGFGKPMYRLDDGRLVRRTAAEDPGPLVRWLERRSRLWTASKGLMRRLGELHGIGEWWELNSAFLDAIVAAARASATKVAIVFIPIRRRWRPFAALDNHLRQEAPDVPLLDLGVAWSEPPPGAFYELDGHLTAEGHRLVAEALVPVIREAWPKLARAPR